MDLRHMRFVVALAQEKHFERAARACHVSQPALSAAIRQLEVELGVLIVQRGNRFMGFTREGEIVLEHARRMLAERDAMVEGLAAAKGATAGHVAIGVVPSALPVVARLLDPFTRFHPGVTFGIVSRSSIEIEKGLETYALHAGITYLDNEPLKQVRSLELYRERYGLLVATTSFPADRDRVTWSDAAIAPLCLLTPDMQNRRIIDAVFRSVGATPRVVVETNSMNVLIGGVRHAGWASVVPMEIGAATGLPPELRLVPLVEPEASHAIGLVIADRTPVSPIVEALWKTLEQHALEAIPAGAAGAAYRQV